MRTYEEALAAARPGRPFSNGTEGYGWMDNWCDRCVRDKGTRDEQGRYSIEDQYHCTEFRDEDEGGGDDSPPRPGPPAPEVEGQVDIFAVFADQITEQASREQVPA